MMRPLFFLCLFLLSWGAFAQSTTDEMLGAPKAKYFIQLWPSFKTSGFHYTLDRDDYPSSKAKTLKNLTVGVPMRSKEVAVVIQFYNPVRYLIRTSDSLLDDPSYQSIGEFASALTSLLGTLPKPALKPDNTNGDGGNAPAGGNGNAKADMKDPLTIEIKGSYTAEAVQETNDKALGKGKGTTTTKEAGNWAKKINGLVAEELAEWKFTSLQGKVQCIDTNSQALRQLQELDGRYFNGSIRGVMKKYLLELSQPNDITEFQAVNKRFKKALDSLDRENQENVRLLLAFDELVSGDITKDLLREGAARSAAYSCESFATYSQIVFKRFVRARAEYQEKRNQMMDLGKKINAEIDELMNKLVLPASGSQTLQNAFILNRYDIQLEKMRDVRVVVQERVLNLNASPPSIEETDKRFEGSLRLRAAQTFIAEFSLGGFYTELFFPAYSTQPSGDSLLIVRNTEDYRVGVAAMLNLTLNALDGLAHPLIQLGVGTGNNRPTLLAGAGLRLSWKTPIILTGGPIWHWQQRLQNGLTEGRKIGPEQTLKDNLEYQFVPRPGFYLGLQIGIFK